MVKKIFNLILIVLSLLALSSCGVIANLVGGDSAEPASTPEPTDRITIGMPSDELQFGLTPNESPNFSDIPDATSSPVQDSDALYVETDGGEVRVDPATLEPVETAEQSAVDPGAELDNSADSESEVTSTEPTQENRYPNTGIFIEDDIWD